MRPAGLAPPGARTARAPGRSEGAGRLGVGRGSGGGAHLAAPGSPGQRPPASALVTRWQAHDHGPMVLLPEALTNGPFPPSQRAVLAWWLRQANGENTPSTQGRPRPIIGSCQWQPEQEFSISPTAGRWCSRGRVHLRSPVTGVPSVERAPESTPSREVRGHDESRSGA